MQKLSIDPHMIGLRVGLVPSSVTTVPLTCTAPDEISFSAVRREATPAAAIIFCNRSSAIMKFQISLLAKNPEGVKTIKPSAPALDYSTNGTSPGGTTETLARRLRFRRSLNVSGSAGAAFSLAAALSAGINSA